MTTIDRTSRYALDAAWHAERDRLNSLTELYDPTTIEICTSVGLAPGWHCADVGAGTGSVAERLAELVGPDGSVLATDSDTRFLDPIATERLVVLRHDVVAEPLEAGRFDLVHARLLLEHLPERDAVLAGFVHALAPGGWVVVEDLDWATASVTDPPSPVHAKVADACMTLFGGHAYDPYFGRRLPRAFADHGLTDVHTRAVSVQVKADGQRGVPQWELLVDQLSPGLLALGLVTQADLDAFHALWHDGDSVSFAPLMISTWGRRPD